jgi:peptidoglycan/LPS O-acetylase OafA/YrhL
MIMHTSKPGEVFAHGGFIRSIEGMRALAVLVVLLFHLDIPAFEGGYLGVDLSFVISGFIITRNILSDLHGGSFSLKEFYIRRFRRLFPALLVSVLLTLVVAILIVPPIELVNTAKSAIFAVFSLANFHFWLESGYFDGAASTKPLLHTWSLSVEEQFYLFWPALVLLLANAPRHMIVAVVLLLLSLGSALLWRN